ncbi:hypothetical protein Tco_1169479 [Tanacetum coccineum]
MTKKDDQISDVDDEGDDHISDTQDTDNEDDENESDEDEIYKYKIRVRKDEDEDMLNAEVVDTGKGDAEVSDAAKADAEKSEEVKDDSKKVELPPTSSSLSISSGFGDQFFKFSFDTSLVGTVKHTTDVEINSLLDIKIQSEVLHIQSPFVLRVPVTVISEPTVLTPLQETSSAASNQTPTVDLEQESEKSPLEIHKIKKEQDKKQKTMKFTIKSTNKGALKEFDQKSALYHTMHANKSFNRNPANHRLYHALMEALIEDENAMDKGVTDTIKDHKRKHDDDKDPPARPNQGKAPSKGSKTGKSTSAKEPVKEPIAEVVTDDAGKDVVRDDDQLQDTYEPITAKTPNPK